MAGSSAMIPHDDNAASLYEEYRESLFVEELVQEVSDVLGVQEETDTNVPTTPTNPITPPPVTPPTNFLETFFHNIVEIPIQFGAGIIDVANNALQLIHELGDILVGMGVPDARLQITNPAGELDVELLNPSEAQQLRDEGALEMVQFPVPDAADTTTGAFFREIARFLTGFIPAVRGVKFLRGTQGAGTSALEATTAAAISAAVVRDPHETRLATLLNDVPFLEAIVPDYLADNNPENETMWEGRMKNAIDEAGVGLAADGLLKAFKFYKAQRKANRLANDEFKEKLNIVDEKQINKIHLEASVQNTPAVPSEQLKGLGDPTSQKMFERIELATERVGETTGIPVPTEKIFINMSKLDTPDDVRQLIQGVADADAVAIQAASGGKRKSLGLMIRESDSEYRGLQDLIGRNPGAMTAAQALAARKILTASGEQLVVLAKTVRDSPEPSSADLYAFRRAMAVHYAIQSEVVAARTETARALRSWAIPVGTDKQRGEAIQELLNTSNKAKSTAAIARTIASMDTNMKGVNTAVSQFSDPTISDAVYQYWINGILSGPTTQVVNVLGNSIMAAYVIPRTLVDASISKAFYDGEISYLEATSAAFGMVKGFRNGLRLLWHGNKAEGIGDLKEPFEQFSKVEGMHQNALTSRNRLFKANEFNADSAFGRGIDYLGNALNLPTSMLRGMDTVFKAVGYQMEVQKQAMRQGLSEGLDGAVLAKRVQELTDNPPPTIKAEAINVAHYQTFTNPLEERGIKIVKGIRAIPGLRYIAPFLRTPTNIFKVTFQGTPLALASRQVRADIAAGGTRAAQAWGRIGTGTILMMAASDMAMEGTITGGGPTDPVLRSNLMATGWRPYSVKIGDTYYSYNRAEPIGNFLAFGADLAEVLNNLDDPDADDLLSTGILGFTGLVKSKTWLRSVIRAITAFDPSNPYSTPGKWVKDFIPSFIPYSSFWRQLAKSVDPTLKITDTALGDPDLIQNIGEISLDEDTSLYLQNVMNKIRSKVPYFGKDLPPRVDLWGEPITTASGYGMAFDLLSPIYASEGDEDRLERILVDNKIPVSHVQKTIMGVKLTAQEQHDYAVLAGKTLREVMERVTSLPGFKSRTDGPDGMKSFMVQDMVRKSREFARGQMINDKNGSLKKRIIKRERLKRQNLLGETPAQDASVSAPVLPMTTNASSASKTAQDLIAGR